MTTHDVLEHFTAARAETVDLLSALQPGDWWRTAYHEEFGPITLLDHVCYFTRHERSHVPQLMQIVRAATQS